MEKGELKVPVATISSKGQITLPAASRRALGLKPHDRVYIQVTGDAIIIKPALGVLSLAGFLGKAHPPEEERRAMMEGVARHVLGKE